MFIHTLRMKTENNQKYTSRKPRKQKIKKSHYKTTQIFRNLYIRNMQTIRRKENEKNTAENKKNSIFKTKYSEIQQNRKQRKENKKRKRKQKKYNTYKVKQTCSEIFRTPKKIRKQKMQNLSNIQKIITKTKKTYNQKNRITKLHHKRHQESKKCTENTLLPTYRNRGLRPGNAIGLVYLCVSGFLYFLPADPYNFKTRKADCRRLTLQ